MKKANTTNRTTKVLSFILAATIFITMFTALSFTSSANAAAAGSLFEKYTANQVMAMYPTSAKLIAQGLDKKNDTIVLSGDEEVKAEHIGELYRSVLLENPNLYFVNPQGFGVTGCIEDGKTIYTISPYYLYDEDYMEIAEDKLEDAVQEIMEQIQPGWTDMKKARYVHDYIATNCAYIENYTTTVDNYEVFTAYGALVNGIAYCEGYALAYNYILGMLGIEAEYVMSLQVNHGWSLVKIDGSYYHVDVTYDDPMKDNLGRVNHTYFLLSDAKLTAIDNSQDIYSRHTGWITDAKAANTKYDNAWWRDVKTVIYPNGNRDYYIDQCYGKNKYGALLAYDETTGKAKEIEVIKTRWYTDAKEKKYYSKNFSYLIYRDDNLYFNDNNNIFRFSIVTGEIEKYSSAKQAAGTYVYGLAIYEDALCYAIKNNPNNADTIVQAVYNAAARRIAVIPQESGTEEKTNNTVVEKIDNVAVIKTEKTFEVGRKYTMAVEDAEGAKITYKTTNNDVVKINAQGTATALKKGTATINITVVKDNAVIKKVQCKVKVTRDPKINKTKLVIKKGKTATILLTGKAADINNKYVNTKIAKFTSGGKATKLVVKGLKKGSTTVKVTVNGVKTMAIKVEVK